MKGKYSNVPRRIEGLDASENESVLQFGLKRGEATVYIITSNVFLFLDNSEACVQSLSTGTSRLGFEETHSSHSRCIAFNIRVFSLSSRRAFHFQNRVLQVASDFSIQPKLLD